LLFVKFEDLKDELNIISFGQRLKLWSYFEELHTTYHVSFPEMDTSTFYVEEVFLTESPAKKHHATGNQSGNQSGNQQTQNHSPQQNSKTQQNSRNQNHSSQNNEQRQNTSRGQDAREHESEGNSNYRGRTNFRGRGNYGRRNNDYY